MVIDIKKCELRTATPNDFKVEIREIVQCLENYVNKDLEQRRVLLFIEDDSTKTDTDLKSHFIAMAWNLTRESITNWLVGATLKNPEFCLSLLDAFEELHKVVHWEFPKEFERLRQYDGKTMRIEFAKLVKKLAEKMS
nr:MAG TPA: hypothetical protein [Caudoviricetes sp.]